MEVEFRQAQPEDAHAVAPLIHASGPAAFAYVFSHRTRMNALEFLERNFAQPHGEFGYRIHTVGVRDGNVVAVGTIYSGRDTPAFFLAAARQVFSCYGLSQGLGVSRRGIQVERLCRVPTGDLLYISHLGVTPEFRGQGIGRCLIERLLATGRPAAKGETIVALDVACNNLRAQALYERMGFETTQELHSTLENSTATVPSYRRMELRL